MMRLPPNAGRGRGRGPGPGGRGPAGMSKYTEGTSKVLQLGGRLAHSLLQPEILPLHVATAMFTAGDETQSLPARIFTRLGVDAAALQRTLEAAAKEALPPVQDPRAVSQFRPRPGVAMMKVMRKAQDLQRSFGDALLASDALLLALFEDPAVSQVFQAAGVTLAKCEAATKEIRGTRKVTSPHETVKTDNLQKYATNMVHQAETGKLDPVIGRDDEIRRVIRVLCRRSKNNPVLIGDPGVGKTAIVEGLAQRIFKRDVPESLQVQVWSLDMGSLVAGASVRGELEKRLKAVLDEVSKADGKIVLFIDEMHLLMGAGRSGSDSGMDAANLLKPALARGELRCIGATTLDEYRKYIERDAAFERRFQQVLVSEPSVEDTICILRGLKHKYAQFHGVQLLDAALVNAAQLADRYITQRFLPDKAIDLVDEACANVRVQLDSQPEFMDDLERRKIQLQVEQQALSGERKDARAAERLRAVQQALGNINEALLPLRAQLEDERAQVNRLRQLRQRLEQLRAQAEAAELKQELEVAAGLRYKEIPDVEAAITKLEERNQPVGSSGGSSSSAASTCILSDVVGPDQIAEVVSRWLGIPVTRLTASERERVLRLPEALSARVVGQPDAVEAVTSAILRSRCGLSSPHRPLGSFLFLGPTGVGKTELAKALAEQLFDSDENMVRVDMSEYMEPHSVARLIGSPPGYVGYDQGGYLTEAIRRRPYSVVLLDEVEKAHANVWNVFLQVLDDGRLTDGKGKTVDFSNVIVILTSNLGAAHFSGGEGTTAEAVLEKVMEVVRKNFRPEFLNRLDDVILFRPLQKEQLQHVVQLQAKELSGRLASRKNIQLVFSGEVLAKVVEEGFHPTYGARPMRRYLEKHVMTPLASKLLSNQLTENCQVTIRLAAADGGGSKCKFAFVLTPLEPSTSAASAVPQPVPLPAGGDGSHDDEDVDDLFS